MIEAQNIQKRFGKVQALDGVSFIARDGEITGLLGPNGAGKTTALRILYTALKPDEGRALIDGHDAQTAPQKVQAQIGVLPHNHGLYPRMTAREHIRYFGQLHGLSGATLDEAIEDMIARLQLEDIIDRRVVGFSQGQRVKVAIARALIHQPQNALLDEPTSGLDVMATRAMRAFVQKLKAAGRCVLLSSHIMQEVSMLCDRIIVIAQG